MAGFPTLLKVILPFCEFMDDDDSYFYQHHTEETCALVLSQKREWTPKVSNYMETVFHEFSIPENIDDFRVHYRVSRHLFEILLQEIYESILLRGTGPQETTQPHKQLLVTLWYLSNMASMREVGHIFDMSKSTVHAVVFRVFDAILGLQPRVVCWPNAQRQMEIAQEVENLCQLRGVIGFIDGTHVRLSSAIKGDRDFYNRKGYPSMQVQCVVDHEMKFTNVYTGWPGCVHDARVLRNSALYREAEAGNLILQDHHIFGDSAYPLQNWLVTPFKNFGNLTPQQIRFNKRLSSARQIVERAFGHLKGRFRRLQDVPFHDSMEVCKMILSACILHNLCIINSDEVEDYINVRDEDPNDCQNIYQNGQNGVVRRLQLVNTCIN
uniref:Protein ANTAGONIST OF LIKE HETEROCHROMATIN PROTEIN 1-like n=1 Tax=Crassostrea virginica TaxID=6565 RepID=A0A8B8C9P5_CRAVI|nr:protein ANTAGONIST OF LIKE HETEROCHROMATIN PROTEIN 1-like [Crassostrea virginica]